MEKSNDNRHWRVRYRPYLIAIVIALITTMLIAPEKVEGDSMEPALSDGQVIIMTKTSYSAKRGAPESGQVVVMEKWVGEELYEDNLIGRVSGLPGETIRQEDGTELKLAKDEVYLLCDNRGSTDMPDSRLVGPVKLEDIRGNAKWIVWPLTDIGGID